MVAMKRKFFAPCTECGAEFSWMYHDTVEEEGDIFVCENCNHMIIDRSVAE